MVKNLQNLGKKKPPPDFSEGDRIVTGIAPVGEVTYPAIIWIFLVGSATSPAAFDFIFVALKPTPTLPHRTFTDTTAW